MTGVLAAMLGGRTPAPLAVTASNVSRTEFTSGSSAVVTTVALPNTTITGGVGPYTQAWTRQSGGMPTVSDANALNPTWTETVNTGTASISTQRVTVTDATSATATFEITVTLRAEPA